MKREITEKLLIWLHTKPRKPLLLQGARQVGKTYSLKMFGGQCFPCFHYVNFEAQERFAAAFAESLHPRTVLSHLELILGRQINPECDLLILDEIQACPRALTSLKYFAEELPQLAVCAAGSLLGVHLSTVSFPVGKVTGLRMYPMVFGEFLTAAYPSPLVTAFEELSVTAKVPQVLHEELWQAFKTYLVVGGMPAAVAAYTTLQEESEFLALKGARQIQEQLLIHYTSDMAKHCGKQNAMHIERLWRNIPAQLAKDLSGSAPKFVFKDVLPGIRGYERLAGVIDWLEAAGLLIRVPLVNRGLLPFAAYTKENSFKLFLFDIGMLGALSGLPIETILDYSFGSYKGYIAENAVIQALTAAEVGSVACWREGQAEVEFLINIGSAIIPIEVKSGNVTQAKSLRSFEQKYNPPFSIIISGRNGGVDPDKKRCYYPLYQAASGVVSPLSFGLLQPKEL